MLAQIANQVAMAVNNALAYRRIAELRDRLRFRGVRDQLQHAHEFGKGRGARGPCCVAGFRGVRGGGFGHGKSCGEREVGAGADAS